MLAPFFDSPNRLVVHLRSGAVVFIAIILAGCSPSPLGTSGGQSTSQKPLLGVRTPRLPVTPTVASHDAIEAPVIDGSNAPRVQWPITSETSSPMAVIEVSPSQQLRWSAEYPLANIHDLAWSPDGEMLAVGGMTYKTDSERTRSPTLVYSQDGTVAAELFTKRLSGNGDSGSISDLEWSSDGRILATADGLNGSASMFYPPTERKVVLTDVGWSVHAVRWSPDGNFVILVTGDRDLYLYDAEGQRIDVVGPAGSTKDSLAWHPDGTMLACTDPLGVMLWGLRANSSTEESATSVSLVPLVRVSLPLGKEQWPATVEWSQDGSRLAVGAFGTGDVWLIDQDGTPLATLQGHTESIWKTRFSSQGILATTSSDATTRLWDQDGKPIAVLVSATPEEDILIDVAAWSPTGDLLAVVSPSKLIRVYSSDAVPVANLLGHTGNIQAISWHPHEDRLASGDDNRITCIWNLPKQPK